MLPIKGILCPTDFSEPSRAALEVAVELAAHFSSDLSVVHVVSPVLTVPGAPAPTGFHIPSVLQEMVNSAEGSLERLVNEKVPAEIPCKKTVVQGNPADEIIRIASGNRMALIVIATHGLTGWRRFIFGSVAEKVVRLSPCPVLTIQHPPDEGGA